MASYFGIFSVMTNSGVELQGFSRRGIEMEGIWQKVVVIHPIHDLKCSKAKIFSNASSARIPYNLHFMFDHIQR